MSVGVGNEPCAQQSVAVETEFAVPGGTAHVPTAVLSDYGLDDAHIELLTGGRTNRTLRVRAGRDVVLQQMHGRAHPDLLGVMENLVRVTSHLEWRRTVGDTGDSWYPLLVPTTSGTPFIMTEDGDVWRAFSYRAGQILRSSLSLGTLASAAALYGRFAAETADLGGPPLIETAPGFHDLDAVCDLFELAVDDASPTRRDDIQDDLAMLAGLKAQVDGRCADDGLQFAPDRVVHNDTKLSNILFDRVNGRAIAVLDLDLAMMGPSWHDVGDLVRSACWHAPDAQPQRPATSTQLFDAIVGAFVEAGGETISDDEIATFAVAGPRISLELGVRYLHDHLRQDPHLRVSGENGHLLRGRANLMLAQEMLGAYDALRQVVDELIETR